MDKIKDFEVSVFEGKRSWYDLLLASVFFSIFIYLLILLFYNTYFELSLIVFLKRLAPTIGLGGFCFIKGLQFSATKNMLIDLDTNTIVSRYIVGPFTYDSKTKAAEFEYVSFFKNKDDSFGTNLWYKVNRHFKMYSFEKEEAARNFSVEIAKKLNIDLLDATEKGNSKWIDKLGI
jgi:hypothetical protein